MDEQLAIGPGTSIRVVARSAELLELEATYDGAGSPPPPHFHPEQDERFEMLAGALRARVGDEDRALVAGEVLEIPHGTVHQMWNDGEEPAVVNWRTIPAGRTLDWFRVLAALARGEDRGDPAALLTQYRDVFRLA